MRAQLDAMRTELESAWPGVRISWDDFVSSMPESGWDDLRLGDLYLLNGHGSSS